MATVTIPDLKEKMVIPTVSSSYPTLGEAYRLGGYTFDHSRDLVRTGENYYDSKQPIEELGTEGLRMSTACEELAIQLALEKAGEDPRKAKVFDDLFVRGSDRYIWQWTETGLRVPKGRKADAYETDNQGRKYWSRIVLIGDQEIGEVLVPEGHGRVVVEWDEVFGLPKVTEYIDWPHNPYTTHFWFDPTPPKDSRSVHYDVAVARRSYWLPGEAEGCLDVVALYGRWDAGSGDGFRPVVRGSVPEIEKELARINPKDVEQTFLKRIRTDYRKIPFPEFQKKYGL